MNDTDCSQLEESLPADEVAPRSPSWRLRVMAVVALVAFLLAGLQLQNFTRQKPEDVVRAQLKALNRSDFKVAYSYAATSIKELYPPDAFRKMIETGYPQFAKWRQHTIGKTKESGNAAVVPVTLIGWDGVTVHAVYFMVREEGSWKVGGVQTDRNAPPRQSHPSPETQAI